MNLSLGLKLTTEELGESMDMGDDMDMGMSTDMDTSEHHHETHFRGMDAPGDDSGTSNI